MTRSSALFAGFAVLALVAVAQAEPLPTEQALKERIMGNPEAPVTIIEYASLTCPHCADFHTDTLPQLKKEWIETGRAKLVYRDFPTSPVALAVYAAMVARCAPEDRYFKFLEVFYKQQRNWTGSPDPVKALAQLARLGGMSQADFDACTQNEALFTGIRERALDGQMEFDIENTPSFVVNGRVIKGGMSYADFKDVLEGAAK
ncbi:MAG: DsbA family protein [Alphaproteobacteria bacterium]|nr:DsbA family protein [Alphaproteobacteria bacterium]